jgi:hypothetical protein
MSTQQQLSIDPYLTIESQLDHLLEQIESKISFSGKLEHSSDSKAHLDAVQKMLIDCESVQSALDLVCECKEYGIAFINYYEYFNKVELQEHEESVFSQLKDFLKIEEAEMTKQHLIFIVQCLLEINNELKQKLVPAVEHHTCQQSIQQRLTEHFQHLNANASVKLIKNSKEYRMLKAFLLSTVEETVKFGNSQGLNIDTSSSQYRKELNFLDVFLGYCLLYTLAKQIDPKFPNLEICDCKPFKYFLSEYSETAEAIPVLSIAKFQEISHLYRNLISSKKERVNQLMNAITKAEQQDQFARIQLVNHPATLQNPFKKNLSNTSASSQ